MSVSLTYFERANLAHLIRYPGAARCESLWVPVFMRALTSIIFLIGCSFSVEATAFESPRSVKELWADFDPRQEPLNVEVIREWKDGVGAFRHVRFLVGHFKGQPARMTAIYGFPHRVAEKVPAVMHIHGGGQRGSFCEVAMLVARGYAALSVNWGGSGDGRPPLNSVEGAEQGDPNTDWGAVDPTQLNVQGYSSLLPGPKQLFEDREHPKNSNWYLLTVGCRRGLTFLEQQPEVDPLRLGVHGYSMGGNLAIYVAGTDHRVRVAVPGVGGQGWRWERHLFADGGEAKPESIRGDIELFRDTLSFESYAPLIRCPILHRGATNDFHAWMDDVYRTNSLIPDQPTLYCFTPHFDHRLSHQVAVAMPLWFDHFLKGGPPLPATPVSQLVVKTSDGVPELRVFADEVLPVSRCEIFYSIDPDPRARFWRGGDVQQRDGFFVAKTPLHASDRPLFAFANLYFQLPSPVSLAPLPGYQEPIDELCLSGILHTCSANLLQQSGVIPTLARQSLIDDFRQGMRDWYLINQDHISLRQAWTRKLTDPAWRGEGNDTLALTLRVPRTNVLHLVVVENEWRNYRGRRKTFICSREIPGNDQQQTITFRPEDFSGVNSTDGELKSWDEIDLLGLCNHFDDGKKRDVRIWQGPGAEFVRLAWERRSAHTGRPKPLPDDR